MNSMLYEFSGYAFLMAQRTLKAEHYDARTTAFLLTQVGSHAGYMFAGQVAELGITTAQVGILLTLSNEDGISQASLAKRLGVVAARAVVLIDDLEERGFVSRSKSDRRTYAIKLTDKGQKSIAEIKAIARRHDESYFQVLSSQEKSELRALLEKLANHHSMSPNAPACKPVILTPVKRPDRQR